MPNMKAFSHRIKELWQMLKFFKSRSKVTVKVTRSKCMVPSERPCHKEHTCQILKLYLIVFQSRSKVTSRSQFKNMWFRQKGLVIRYTHAKYESPIYYDKKIMVNVKVFFKSRSKVTVKVTSSKCMVPMKRSCHKDHTCQIWKTYLQG